MINKLFIKFFLFLFLLNNCGFTPIYKNIENVDFKININDLAGIREINNQIKSNLESYSLAESNKIFNISSNSNYTKNIITKDKTGAATEYKVILNIIFLVSNENNIYTFEYNESFNMKSMNDKLDEKEYEESLQKNLINIITQKLILQLSRI